MIALTFDNLGEAAEIQLGAEPDERGRHFSVTEVLPRLLDALAERELRATFFVEGLNAELYPDALREIAGRGHEVGYHAWCHEEWGALDGEAQADNLRRGAEAFEKLELRARGFRPPGGALDAAGERALAQLGFAYASPEGDEPVAGDVVRMPFRWPLVDAYWVLPNYAERRESAGHEEGAENFVAEVERAIAAGGYVPLIMHPFLWADPATERADREVLDRVASAGAQRMGDAAESLR